jgi:hypothetical protein
MRFCAAVVFVMATPLVAAGVRLGPRKTFCGISVRAPQGYHVEQFVPENSDVPCAIGMKPTGWNEDPSEDAQEDGDYAITLDVYAGSFDEAAERAGFIRVKRIRVTPEDGSPIWPSLRYRDDDWVTMGAMSILNRAQAIQQPSWTGLTGEETCTFYRRHGGHAGMGKVVVAAIVSRTKPTIAVIMSSGALQSDQARAVIQTVQILPRR